MASLTDDSKPPETPGLAPAIRRQIAAKRHSSGERNTHPSTSLPDVAETISATA